MLHAAGIACELEQAVEHHPTGLEDAPPQVLVPRPISRPLRTRSRHCRTPTTSSASEPSADFGPLAGRLRPATPGRRAWHELLDVVSEAATSAGRPCSTSAAARARSPPRWRARGAGLGRRSVPRRCSPRRAAARRPRGRPQARARRGAAVRRRPVRAPRAAARRPSRRPAGRFPSSRACSRRRPAVIATFEPEHFDRFWLTRLPVDPGDRPRPLSRTRCAHGRAAGGGLRDGTERLSQRQPTREEALERIRGRYISTLLLLGGRVRGRARARRARAPRARSSIRLEWALVAAAEGVALRARSPGRQRRPVGPELRRRPRPGRDAAERRRRARRVTGRPRRSACRLSGRAARTGAALRGRARTRDTRRSASPTVALGRWEDRLVVRRGTGLSWHWAPAGYGAPWIDGAPPVAGRATGPRARVRRDDRAPHGRDGAGRRRAGWKVTGRGCAVPRARYRLADGCRFRGDGQRRRGAAGLRRASRASPGRAGRGAGQGRAGPASTLLDQVDAVRPSG